MSLSKAQRRCVEQAIAAARGEDASDEVRAALDSARLYVESWVVGPLEGALAGGARARLWAGSAAMRSGSAPRRPAARAGVVRR